MPETVTSHFSTFLFHFTFQLSHFTFTLYPVPCTLYPLPFTLYPVPFQVDVSRPRYLPPWGGIQLWRMLRVHWQHLLFHHQRGRLQHPQDMRVRRRGTSKNHIIPFIHPLYTFIAVFAPMYTRYTCMYTICTPNTPLNTLYTPHIRPKYAPKYALNPPLPSDSGGRYAVWWPRNTDGIT